MKHQYPNAGALIDHCHQIFIEARGIGHLDRPYNMNETTASYLAGLSAAYIFDIRRMRMYFSECVMMLRGMGFHRPSQRFGNSDNSSTSGDAQRSAHFNKIYQESGKRLFWLMFVGAMSGRQLDEPEGDILMPPVAFVEMLPELPAEVDDQYITEEKIFSQPEGVVSELVGFNLNCKIYRAFHILAAIETAFGTDTVYDWERQKQVIRKALHAVKGSVSDAPKELQLNMSNDFGEWPPQSYDASVYAMQDSYSGQYPYPEGRRGSLSNLPFSKRTIQYEIQKANIYCSLLATRSYLVERYWNLYEIHERDKANQATRAERIASITSTSSPTSSTADHKFLASMGQTHTPSDSAMDTNEQTMAVERENIVRDLAVLLKSINQVNMEPNGLSLVSLRFSYLDLALLTHLQCSKVRQIASTLLETKRATMSVMPTLNSESVNEYLYEFLSILDRLQRLGAGRIRPDEAGEYGMGRSAEEIEDEELVHWASLKDRQERFIQSEAITLAQ